MLLLGASTLALRESGASVHCVLRRMTAPPLPARLAARCESDRARPPPNTPEAEATMLCSERGYK
eukprot:scaffold3587_cov364-Prasinococcus_capsulatus_cf.AAC.2